MSKCQASDTLTAILLKASESQLQNSCTGFVLQRLLPALLGAGVFSDEEPQTDAKAYGRWKSRVLKRVSRVISGEQPLPADWFIPWMQALPESAQSGCRNSAAIALGLYPVNLPAPDSRQQGTIAGIDVLTREFADVLAAARPGIDGVYSTSDRKNEVQQLLDQLQELHSYILAEIVAIAAGTGIMPTYPGRLCEHRICS